MQGKIFLQGLEVDNFINSLSNQLATEVMEKTNWINVVGEFIPYLNLNQTAVALKCSTPHVSTIIQRYPEKLKPLYLEGRKTPVFKTTQVLELSIKGIK